MHLVMKVCQLDWTIFKHSSSTAQKPEGCYYGQFRKYWGFFFFFPPFFKNKSSSFPTSNPLLGDQRAPACHNQAGLLVPAGTTWQCTAVHSSPIPGGWGTLRPWHKRREDFGKAALLLLALLLFLPHPRAALCPGEQGVFALLRHSCQCQRWRSDIMQLAFLHQCSAVRSPLPHWGSSRPCLPAAAAVHALPQGASTPGRQRWVLGTLPPTGAPRACIEVTLKLESTAQAGWRSSPALLGTSSLALLR